MFKQQKKATGYVPRQQAGLLRVKLREAGYEVHSGPALARDRETHTLRKSFRGQSGVRQNHVSIEERGSVAAVYAHTEPHTDDLIGHTISALTDGASFTGGSRMLKRDLEDVGLPLMSHDDAVKKARKKR